MHTSAGRLRLPALALITAALAGGIALSSPTTHAHAMPRPDPTCRIVTGTPLPSPGGAVPGSYAIC